MSMQEDFEKAEKDGKAERITARRAVLKEKDVFFGVYRGCDLIASKKKGMKDSYSYRFDTDDGPATLFMSSAFDEKHREGMQEGALYRIEYRGKIPIGEGHTFKDFDVRKVVALDSSGRKLKNPKEVE